MKDIVSSNEVRVQRDVRDITRAVNNLIDEDNPVAQLKDRVPDLVERFEHLQMEELLLFCKKNLDYGTKNITKGLDMNNPEDLWFIMVSLWTKISDKINRWQNILRNGNKLQVADETVLDTLQDISNYCNIAQLLYRGQWQE